MEDQAISKLIAIGCDEEQAKAVAQADPVDVNNKLYLQALIKKYPNPEDIPDNEVKQFIAQKAYTEALALVARGTDAMQQAAQKYNFVYTPGQNVSEGSAIDTRGKEGISQTTEKPRFAYSPYPQEMHNDGLSQTAAFMAGYISVYVEKGYELGRAAINADYAQYASDLKTSTVNFANRAQDLGIVGITLQGAQTLKSTASDVWNTLKGAPEAIANIPGAVLGYPGSVCRASQKRFFCF